MMTLKTTTAALLATGLVCGGAQAAVTQFQGLQTDVLDNVIGAGNTGQLIGDAQTHWASTTSVSIVDLNGFTLTLDSGNGNAQTYNGAITGPGTLGVTGRFEVDSAFDDLTVGGSSANTMSNVVINQGTLNLNKDAGVDALTGPITFVGGNAGEISWVQSNQINDGSSIDSTGGGGAFSLELNDNTDTIAGLALKAGDVVETGSSGVLTVASLTIDGQTIGGGAYTSGNSSFVTGGGQVNVIPEPGSLALLGIGGLMIARRRRRG